nr:cytochrome P450 3A5-like isoform X2 [Dermacentor andersoni]
MTSLVEKCADVTLRHLKKAASNEEDIELKHFYGNYSLDVIARCAFATELDSYSDNTNEFVTKTRESFSGRISPRILFSFAFPRIAKALGIQRAISDSFEYFVQICKTIIRKRQDKQERHDDFLQLMMDAQESDLNAAAENVSEREDKLFNLGSEMRLTAPVTPNKTLTEDEAVAQCVLFLIAGQDTVSTAIAHTLYLLAIHPEVQEKLRKEVDDCFVTNGEHPSLDAVLKLKYLHCVVSESLRIYPPSTRIQRTADSDYILSHTGVKVKKGDVIAVPIYSMHHDPRYFSNPSTFNPERCPWNSTEAHS